MSFRYTLPTTGSIKFTDFLYDPSGEHITHISNASAARGRMRAALKDYRRAEGRGDAMSCFKATEDYVPHLLAIINCLERDTLLLRAEPTFTWRSVLGSYKVRSEPRFNLPGSLALCNIATSQLTSLGPYEKLIATSDSDRKKGDEKVNEAASLLCKASGRLKYLADVAFPRWESGPRTAGGGGSGTKRVSKPPDLTREIITALSKLSLADAELLAIRRLLSKDVAIARATITPGPPLPKSHPSPSLLAKLHLNVHSLYDEARSLAKSVGGTSNSVAGRDEVFEEGTAGVSTDLRTYLANGRSYAIASSYRWIGIDSGENGRSQNNIGDAITYLTMAREEFVKLGKGGGSSVLSGFIKGAKEKDRDRDGWKRRTEGFEDDLKGVEGYLKSYRKLNETVTFQTIPQASSLLNLIPTGRSALSIVAYAPPTPAFAPGAAVQTPTDFNFDQLRLSEGVEGPEDPGDDSSDEGDSGVEPSIVGSTRAYY